jgi:hypothetical protein
MRLQVGPPAILVLFNVDAGLSVAVCFFAPPALNLSMQIASTEPTPAKSKA